MSLLDTERPPELIVSKLDVPPPLTGLGSKRRLPSLRGVAAPASTALQCAVLAELAAVPYSGVFHGWRFLVPLSGACVLGAVVAGLGEWRPLRRLRILGPVAALVFAVYAVEVLYRDRTTAGLPGPAAVRAVSGGLVHGIARILTVGEPADPVGDLLAVPVLISFACGLVGGLLALRTTAPLWPVLPPLLAFVVALVLAGAGTHVPLAATGVFVLALLATVLLRTDAGVTRGVAAPRAAVVARAAFTAPVLAFVCVLAVLGAWLLPLADGQHRFDPRRHWSQQVHVDDSVSPAAQLKGELLENPAQRLFTVTVRPSAGISVDRVRVAALDVFDGALWGTQGTYQRVGTHLQGGTSAGSVSLTIGLQGLTGPFLPSAAESVGSAGAVPTVLSAGGFGYDAATQNVVTDRSALAGLSYSVSSTANPVTPAGLARALPDGHLPALSALPGPDLGQQWMKEDADQIIGSERGVLARLQRLQSYLTSYHYSLAPQVPPGESYKSVDRMLRLAPTARFAFAEQTASAFALLARAEGYPARVAFGYLLNPKHLSRSTYDVTSQDAHVWAEVAFSGYGWVPFEVTNRTDSPLAPPPSAQNKVAAGTKGSVPDQAVVAAPGPAPIAGGGQQAGTNPVLILAAVLVGLVALVLLAVATLVGVKLLRRGRRRRRDLVSQRIIGAWQEVSDRLVERGLGVAGSWTVRETAAAAGRFGDPVAEPSRVLAVLVTEALYADEQPEPERADEAWARADEVRAALVRVGGTAAWIRAWLNPRPVLPPSVARRLRGTPGTAAATS